MGAESKKGTSPVKHAASGNCLLLHVCFSGERHLLKVVMSSGSLLTQNIQRRENIKTYIYPGVVLTENT